MQKTTNTVDIFSHFRPRSSTTLEVINQILDGRSDNDIFYSPKLKSLSIKSRIELIRLWKQNISAYMREEVI